MGSGRSVFSLRRLAATAAVLVLLAAVAMAVLSRHAAPRIEKALLRWAEGQGYENVAVGGIDLGTFPLRASLEGLQMDFGGRRVVEVEEVRLQLSVPRILSGDSRIDHIALRGARIAVDVAEDGSLRLAGLLVGPSEANGRDRTAGQGRYGVDLLKISDSALLVTAPRTRFTLHVSDLEFRNGRELIADTVIFRGVEVAFIHNADDSWQILSDKGEELASLGTGAQRGKSAITKALSSLSYRIGKVEIAEGSTITHREIAPGEEYEITYRVRRASVTELRSETDASRPSRFIYELDSNRHVRILMEGTARFPGEDREVLMSGRVEGLELLSLSPYTSRSMGFAIDSGQADADLETMIRGSEVEGHVDARINLLTVSTADKEKLKAFEETLPGKIKLTTAVRLMSDRQGSIRLKVPVSGDVSAPTFGLDLDISLAVNNALGNIVKTGLFVAAPWAVATIDALFAERAPFGEVPFAPLSDEVDERVEKAIADFARKFSRKSEVLALVRGCATEREMKILPEDRGKDRSREVLAIAEQRSRKVKDILVYEHGIEARRLIICRPVIDYWDRSRAHIDPFGEQDTRVPRVELR